MQKYTIAVVAALLLEVSSVDAADQLIRNVNVVDVEAGTILPGRHILIEDGIIIEVTEEPPAEAPIDEFDAKGGYVIPGLWDSHVHVFSSPEEPSAAFPLYVINGVTSIRDMGGLLPFEQMKRVASAVEAGDMLGPRVVLSGA